MSTVSFDVTGQFLLTAGNDGAVLLHTVKPPKTPSEGTALPEQPAQLGVMADVDAVDEDAELTEVIGVKNTTILTATAQQPASCYTTWGVSLVHTHNVHTTAC